MTDAVIDVVIPVWNRTTETRNCLVNLINNTPDARLIMYDSGSDRDAERLLQEIADSLEDRALHMRDDANIGFVKAANRGMARSEAAWVALVRNTTQVCAGWIEPLLDFAAQHPEAGILVPCCLPSDTPCPRGPLEVSSGSFSVMVIKRELYQQIGGFDEGMDDGVWCLRDYSRRACSRGFLTFQVPGPCVSRQAQLQFGSERRRQETLQRTRQLFRERWGESGSYVLHVPKGVELSLLRQKLEWLVRGARHGDRYSVMLPSLLHKEALQEGLDLLHENIVLVPLPRIALESGRRRVFENIVAAQPGTVAVTAVDGLPFPWSTSFISFSELGERIDAGYL
jgi:GT2 family glycosyltransferase